jgi:glycosyltransferase involved in cell wall biosynthesis
MLPLISVIIPTYNRSHLIGETLESIISQTYSNWECIVVDDGSLDYTEELMNFYVLEDTRITYVKRPISRTKGANACRNYGFEVSKGDYINWFDDDDVMHSRKLELQLSSLENSGLNFSVCQTLVFRNNVKNILGLRNEMIKSDNPFCDYLTMKIMWLTHVPLWRRKFLIDLGFLFDEELQAAQEWEFHLRVLNKFSDYTIVDNALVLIRKHTSSITYSKNYEQRLWDYFLSRLKIYRNTDLTLDPESNRFLKLYLLNSFKKMIVTRNVNIFNAFILYLLPEKNISIWSKINALLAIFGYRLFNRGNVVLQKIKYN